jgi:hypothetical protein
MPTFSRRRIDEMKIFLLFIFLFLISMIFTLLIDQLMGLTFSMAIGHLKHPLAVMTLPEYLILFALFLLMIIPPIFSYYNKRKQTGKA